MVILGDIEHGGRPQFGDDGPRPLAAQFADDFLGGGALAVIVVEDDGTVLRSGIVALAVERSGVVGGEEDLEDVTAGSKVTCTTSTWPERPVQTVW